MSRSLGEFEQSVLLALVELGESAYGAAVARSIEERTGRAVSSGAVYTALDRLQGRGLVESWLGEPTAERGGRRRRHYRLTPEGATDLRDTVRRLEAMAAGLVPKLESMLGEGR